MSMHPTGGTYTITCNGQSRTYNYDETATPEELQSQFWELPDDPFDSSESLQDCEFDDPFWLDTYEGSP